jgi:Ca2+-binding RTX toxin-like protein
VRELVTRGKEGMMRRIILLFMVMAMTLVVASGVAWAVTKIGTDGPDTLRGTKGSDQLLGRSGTDWIEGRAGNDVISGGPGNDDPLASRALGMLDGGPGADVISGGPGIDMLWDGPWPGDSAVDILEGGDGNDYLGVANRPAARDVVSCGAGRDIADIDRKDIVSDDCERTW